MLLRATALSLLFGLALAHNNTAAGDANHICDSDLCSEIITDCKALYTEYHEHGCCGNPTKTLQYIQVGNLHTHTCAELKAQFQQCKTIRDHDGYAASSGFALGPAATNPFGDNCASFKWATSPLQFNLEYEARFALIGSAFTGSVAATQNYWNAFAGRSLPDGNWVDPDNYIISICTPATTSMTMGVYGGSPASSTVQNIQWTVTGWGQTILAGTVAESNGEVKLNVIGYFPFPGEADTNAQEQGLAGRTSSDYATTEVTVYTATGTVATLAEGTAFAPTLRGYKRCTGGTNYRE